ncbi:hypothetical protein RQP46_005799 [Phenoliferia psychrophenolica]
MGCASSSPAVDQGEVKKSTAIEAQIEKERLRLKSEVKMLLLGTGESGKSTILKQMRVIHKGGFLDEERASYRDVLFANIVQGMVSIIEVLLELDWRLQSQNHEHGVFIEELDSDLRVEDTRVTVAILALWSDPAVKAIVDKRGKYQINDSVAYLFDSVERIMDPEYEPTDDDILRARVRTIGITETQFSVGKLSYRLFDVGGQRSERKKWIHCFEGVNVLLFLVAVSEYDQTLFEDESVSRMDEAMALFEATSNSRWFSTSSVVLFFNKIDLLEEKLPKSSLKAAMPRYAGDDLSFPQALEFFHQTFSALYTQKRPLYHHFVTATDTNLVKKVTDVVSDTVARNMMETYLL